MRGLKLLFREWRSFPIALHIFCGLCAIGLALLPFIMYEPLGSEDYIICKLFLFGMPFFMAMLGLICGFRSLWGNKLTRSVPIAKQLYTRSAPAFILILTAGLSCVIMAAYFIFLKFIGAETAHFADALICGAVMNLPPLIVMPLVATVPNGGVMSIWLCYLPIWGFVGIFGKHYRENGFRLSLPVSAAIFAAVVILGGAWTFVISSIKYKRANVNIMPSLNMMK